MIAQDLRTSVESLLKQNVGLRAISRLLRLSRNTVRAIARDLQGGSAAKPEPGVDALAQVTAAPTLPTLPGVDSVAPVSAARLGEVYARARGNVVRMAQILADQDDLHPPYSTLTRWVRQAELRPAPKRSGEYHFEPGKEMQHDTSPHRVVIAGKTLTAQCAALTLGYSRNLFIFYYLQFTRFEAKDFLVRAALYMDGMCERCVIDNTSVILAGGSGADAVVAPEMAAFARTLGFGFIAHRINDPNRKGKIERPFAWIERNFLPGRTFDSLEDMNAQALLWCNEVANAKPKQALGMAPRAAYVMEKPALKTLPPVMPAVYEVCERIVDLYGFVNLETNRYSVPERLVGKAVTVYKYHARIEIYLKRALVAGHVRLVGVRDKRSTLPGHHTIPRREPRAPSLQVQLLLGHTPVLDAYVKALVAHCNGRATRALNRLVQMQRTYPPQPFASAVAQALKYGLFDLARLESLVLSCVAGDFFALQDCTDAAQASEVTSSSSSPPNPNPPQEPHDGKDSEQT